MRLDAAALDPALKRLDAVALDPALKRLDAVALDAALNAARRSVEWGARGQSADGRAVSAG